jgi:hypothetical protein
MFIYPRVLYSESWHLAGLKKNYIELICSERVACTCLVAISTFGIYKSRCRCKQGMHAWRRLQFPSDLSYSLLLCYLITVSVFDIRRHRVSVLQPKSPY